MTAEKEKSGAYAVVETGGKQYRVTQGDVLEIERLETEPGKQVELSSVLAVSDGKNLKVGNPFLKGAKVTATVLKHIRGEKVVSYKKKRRKSYARKIGHRQELTVIKIESV